MWALIRKNLWLWSPLRGPNLYILGLAAAFAIADLRWSFGMAGWLPVIALMTLLFQSGGSDVLGSEYKEDRYRFIEYLPVRWWQVWLANWCDAILANIILIACLTFLRTITWEMPADSHDGPGEQLFASRWILPGLLLGFSVFLTSHSAFWRTFVRTDAWAMIVTFLGGSLVVAPVMAVFVWYRIVPAPRDGVWLLLLAGLLFTVAAAIAFALLPHHWSRPLKFFVGGLPSAIIATATMSAAVALACSRWHQLDLAEPGMTFSCVVNRTGSVSIAASSMRSGDHMLLWDTAKSNRRYLGRAPYGRIDTSPTGDVVMVMPSPRPTLSNNGVLTLLKANGERYALLPWPEFRGEDGRDYVGCQFTLSEDGNHVIAYIAGQRRSEQLLTISRTGQIERRIALNSESYPSFLLGMHGRLLVYPPVESASVGSAQGISAVIYDRLDDKGSVWTLPGPIIDISHDFDKALCQQTATRGAPSALVLCERATGRQTIVMKLPKSESPWDDLTPASRSSDLRAPPGMAEWMGRSSTAVCNAQFSKAAISLHNSDTVEAHTKIFLLDLETLEYQELLDQADAVGSTDRYPIPPAIYGFTAAGDKLVLQIGSELRIYNATSAESTRLDMGSPVETPPQLLFSPSGDRFIARNFRHSQMSSGASTSLYNGGKPVTVEGLDEADSVSWLDEDRIVSCSGKGVSIYDIGRRCWAEVINTGSTQKRSNPARK